MSDVNEFKALLDEIDMLLERYDPGEPTPDKIIRDILLERAKQRPILQRAIQLASQGLEQYPFNSELLWRRAWAQYRIVTPDGTFPELESAEQDLQIILTIDPNNLYAGTELLEMMFTFSGMENSHVAEVAEEFACRAERVLLNMRALQIKALGYARKHEDAEHLYQHWIGLFPDADILTAAKEDADSMRGDEKTS
jgi:hypothetical protein